MDLSTLQIVAVSIIPILLAITVHEAAHGYAAKHFGDDTADKLGRISLNPLRHIDPFGTILLPLFTKLTAGFAFGWAKPVPVNWRNLRNPKRDMLWVAAAGPLSNLAMAIIWAFLQGVAGLLPLKAGIFLVLMADAGISINLLLMVLNLLPILPLDGGRIAVSLLPNELAEKYSQTEKFGLIIIITLMLTGVLGKFMVPIIDFFERAIGSLVVI